MIKQTDVVGIYPQELKSGEIVAYLRLKSTKTYCLAVPSWHVGITGLISYPPIHDHREDWLLACDYEIPRTNDYSRELKERLVDILKNHEEEILERLDSEAGVDDYDFWESLWIA